MLELKRHSESLNKFLTDRGFMCYVANPTEADAEEFVNVMKMTGRSDLKFTPMVAVCYEKQLSRVTSWIVEGYKSQNHYFYDFYKAKFYREDGQATDIKVYGSRLDKQALMKNVEGKCAWLNQQK